MEINVQYIKTGSVKIDVPVDTWLNSSTQEKLDICTNVLEEMDANAIIQGFSDLDEGMYIDEVPKITEFSYEHNNEMITTTDKAFIDQYISYKQNWEQERVTLL